MVERRSSERKGKVPDPEVVARPKRRRFTTECKLRIVRAADVDPAWSREHHENGMAADRPLRLEVTPLGPFFSRS